MLKSSYQQDYHFADNWAEPPDHGLWPISSILEHISPAELAKYLQNLHQELDTNDTNTGTKPKPYDGTPTSEKTIVPFTPVTIGENGRRRYQCTICYKYFTQASSLRVHGRIHTGEKPFQCEICHKAFNQSGSLRLHRTVHSTERPYSCDTCRKTFSRVRSLKLHMRTHNTRRTHKCETCGKCFAHQSSFKVHLKLHSDQRPFTCDHCSKTFDDHEALVCHSRTHRPSKPHECQICGKRFPTSQSLSSHNRVHENEPAKDSSAFESDNDLVLQTLDQHEPLVFECNVCGKAFNRSTSLRAHKISHDRKPKRKMHRGRSRRY